MEKIEIDWIECDVTKELSVVRQDGDKHVVTANGQETALTDLSRHETSLLARAPDKCPLKSKPENTRKVEDFANNCFGCPNVFVMLVPVALNVD